MQSLATELLHELKKTANFWKLATIVCLTLAVVEFMIIVFQKGNEKYGK